jgi:hypothetical protein
MDKRKRTQVEGDDRSVALYHVVYRHEGFEEAAQTLFTLVRDSQAKFPNRRRSLFLEIEGHRNEQGGFDVDMFELQKDFLIGFLSQFLSEIHCPLTSMTNAKGQSNDIPGQLDIRASAERGDSG